MKRLSAFLQRCSPGWVALLALLMFMVFAATVLPEQAAQAEQTSGGGKSPDLSLWYSPGDLYRMAESYGADGRQAYILSHFTFDVVFPIVYGFFLVTAISWLFGKGFPKDSPWQLANLLPLAAMLFDFLENITTSLVMSRFPAETPIVAALAPVCTFLKWMCVGGSMLLLVVGVVAAVTAGIKRKRS
jgi:hypothetical protein